MKNKYKIKKMNKDNQKQDVKIAVCALIYDENYRILTVSRKDNISDYGLIGGKIDRDEFLVDGLIREVKEETGLDVLKHTLLWESMDGFFKVYTFLCQCSGVIGSNESGLIRWLTIDELDILFKSSFGDYNKRLLEYIINNPNKYDYESFISPNIKG